MIDEHMRRRTNVGNSRRAALCGAAAIMALMLGAGCGERDTASRVIAESRNTLEAMAGGGAAPRAVLQSNYAKVVSALEPVARGADSESVSLAHGLLAEALAGQGEIAADTFRSADAELMRAISAASAALSLYVEQRSLQASLQGYDPAADLAMLEKMASERRMERDARQAELDETQSQQAALMAQVTDLEARADEIRRAEGLLRTQASSAATSERLPLVESAHEQRRAWQRLMKQSEELRAEAAQFDPVIARINHQVQQADRQLASLDNAQQQARDQDQALRAQSADAGRAAEEAAAAVGAALDAVLAAMQEGSIPAFQEAAGRYERALTSAGAARSAAARPGATVSVATIAHALGSLRREQGESLARGAALLEWAATVRPALAKSGEYASVASELREQATQVMQQAAEAYERASTSFQSGGSGAADASERMQRISTELEELRRRISGEPEAAESAESAMEAGEEAPTDDSEMGETDTDMSEEPAPEEPTSDDEAAPE